MSPAVFIGNDIRENTTFGSQLRNAPFATGIIEIINAVITAESDMEYVIQITDNGRLTDEDLDLINRIRYTPGTAVIIGVINTAAVVIPDEMKNVIQINSCTVKLSNVSQDDIVCI